MVGLLSTHHARPNTKFRIVSLGHRLRVDPVAPGQHPQALLTILYCSTDRRRRAGAPMENLAHSASFQSNEKSAPSIHGTKHVVRRTSGTDDGARSGAGRRPRPGW